MSGVDMSNIEEELKVRLTAVYTSKAGAAARAAADELALFVIQQGPKVLDLQILLPTLAESAAQTKDANARESACIIYSSLIRRGQVAGGWDPYLLPLTLQYLELTADKTESVRISASEALTDLVNLAPPKATPALLKELYKALDGNGKWQIKSTSLNMIITLVKKGNCNSELAEALGEIVPRLESCLHSTKREVSSTASKCALAICSLLQNPDLKVHIPALVQCMKSPDAVADLIKSLSNTTFVAEVDGPVLAVLVPMLLRALNHRSMEVQRMTVVVLGNLCKLVREPTVAARYLGELVPGVVKIKDTASFPEVRAFAQSTYDVLYGAGATLPVPPARNPAEEDKASLEIIIAVLGCPPYDIANEQITGTLRQSLKFASSIISDYAYNREFVREHWQAALAPYLMHHLPGGSDQAKTAVESIYQKVLERDVKSTQDPDCVEEDGEVLCNTNFSLAYGALLLLNHTTLKLVRGKRYGIVAGNGKGKSTLLKAIRDGKVEGFPPQSEVRTIMVEHALQGEDGSVAIIDFICSDPALSHVDRQQVASTLASVGFDSAKQADTVGSLSGGWKMKLELARAILTGADILLLDEPTNHLDVASIAWLENWLVSNNTTIMTVSHDSSFLDNVCTDIIHYENKRLCYYPGNLSAFVSTHPEATTYYTLSSTNLRFSFPPPGNLGGVRSNTRAIMKLNHCTFAYPGKPTPQLIDVTCALSLSSRVAIIGPNGAGKSTLIKLITGETIPQEGTVYKHPNLRVGYVAQHASHHVEKHLEKTPIQYIQWRFQDGHDREVLEKATRAVTGADLEQMDKYIQGKNGEKRQLECLLGRQKLKKSYQYEVKWRNLNHKFNTWMSREELLAEGFVKIVQQFDDLESSREGAGQRDNAAHLIRKHLEDVGLDGDIAQYNEISGLSGGQKMKLVIAACMWNNPQILILDEPTNFIDRDSLGGLAVAIKEWAGAVCIISHNQEFVGALCPEQWHVEAGRLTHKGQISIVEDAFEKPARSGATSRAGSRNASTVASAANSGDEGRGASPGLRMKPKKKAKKTRNELKAQEERRRARKLAWLSSSIPGAEREPDTESSDDEAMARQTAAALKVNA